MIQTRKRTGTDQHRTVTNQASRPLGRLIVIRPTSAVNTRPQPLTDLQTRLHHSRRPARDPVPEEQHHAGMLTRKTCRQRQEECVERRASKKIASRPILWPRESCLLGETHPDCDLMALSRLRPTWERRSLAPELWPGLQEHRGSTTAKRCPLRWPLCASTALSAQCPGHQPGYYWRLLPTLLLTLAP